MLPEEFVSKVFLRLNVPLIFTVIRLWRERVMMPNQTTPRSVSPARRIPIRWCEERGWFIHLHLSTATEFRPITTPPAAFSLLYSARDRLSVSAPETDSE